MAITLTYNKELEILNVKVVGYLSIDDYKNAALEIISSNEYPSDVNALWDLTQMKFDNIDLQFEEKLIEHRQQHNDQRGHARVAIVSSNTLAEPIIKLFQVLSEHLLQKVKSFHTIEEAQAWLLE